MCSVIIFKFDSFILYSVSYEKTQIIINMRHILIINEIVIIDETY